jgi:hypothetical protein
MGRFETKWPVEGKDLSVLADVSGEWTDRVHARRPPSGIVLDTDSSVSPTHSEQEMSVRNGHYECSCYDRCSSSTTSAIWHDAPCVPATFTAPMAGKAC